MKSLLYYKLSYSEKYLRLKKIWPLFAIGILIFYWKLEIFWASVLTVILITATFIEMHYLKKKIKNQNSKK